MPEECNSGAPLESRVAGFQGTVSQAVGVQCSAAAAAYRGEPTGDWPKGFFGGSCTILEDNFPKAIILWYAELFLKLSDFRKRSGHFEMT